MNTNEKIIASNINEFNLLISQSEYIEENDLFNDIDNLPIEVQSILNKYAKIEAERRLDYPDLINCINELNEVGYTFEYGYELEPFNLHKINIIN
ncbi:MAG: hypothetical protein RLZZ414_1384 [Bacteroidota bacterium]|jgi:hypothetical protein